MQVIHKPKPKPELMTQTELLAYVHELEAENARLEESFQKATGEIAADPLPGECRDLSDMLDDFHCSKCGIYLSDLTKVVKEEYDDGSIDDEHYVYEPKFCPECGRKVMRDEGGAEK